MPANLPPDYFAAESAFRAATSPREKLVALERMLAVMPHHKGTDHLRAELRSRMAKVGQELSRQRGNSRMELYSVRREGAGQAALIGTPNAGKSSLLAALTGASARVGDYSFTTQLPQPAMMPFEDIHVQLVDLPAVSAGVTPAWLRGIAQEADLLLIAIDLDADPAADLAACEGELGAMRIAAYAPDDQDAAAPRNLHAASTSVADGRLARRALVVGTKLDLVAAEDGAELLRLELQGRLPLLLTSSRSGMGIEALRERIVKALDVVRVYAKPPGRPADLQRPFVLHHGATVEDLADAVHHEVRERLRYAVRWTPGGQPVRVAHDYELRDRDVIELHAT